MDTKVPKRTPNQSATRKGAELGLTAACCSKAHFGRVLKLEVLQTLILAKLPQQPRLLGVCQSQYHQCSSVSRYPLDLYEMALKVRFYNQRPGVDVRVGAQLSS